MVKPIKEKKRTLQVPLSPEEDEVLEALQRRFQEAVIARNKKTGEKRIANILQTEMMRAGLLALDEKKPDELRETVLAVIDEKKVKAASN